MVGPDARPTVWFDRGGWSLRVFSELTAAGFEVLTYGKGTAHAEPRHAFHAHRFVDERGCVHEYLLAESHVGIEYDGGRRRFRCRQVTILEPRAGHQTQILTTRRDLDAAAVAYATFQRWGQEDLIEFMRVRCGDARNGWVNGGADAACLASEGERLHDAVRMATFSAASTLNIRLARDQPGDATHLLAETCRQPGELQTVGDELHVRLEPLSGARAPGPSPPSAPISPRPGRSIRAPTSSWSIRWRRGGPNGRPGFLRSSGLVGGVRFS